MCKLNIVYSAFGQNQSYTPSGLNRSRSPNLSVRFKNVAHSAFKSVLHVIALPLATYWSGALGMLTMFKNNDNYKRKNV